MDPPPAAPLSPRAWRLPGGHSLGIGAFVLVVAAAADTLPFASHLPDAMPDVSHWTKVSGSAELDDGTAAMQYELYVNPGGSAAYELIRWRITGWDGGRGGAPYSSDERLQWQVAQKDLRRYQCEPQPAGRCNWRELTKDTREYHAEMPMVLWVLSVHQALLRSRAGGP
jgi:hypothetical protein